MSRVCQAIAEQFDTWKARSLADVELEYLYLDASHFRYHDGARAQQVLVAWGITSDGRSRLIGVDAVSAESHDALVGFLRGLAARGLRSPLLVITDGAPGLIGAVEQVFPHSLRQRCRIHRARNVRAKVSAGDQAQVKADYWAIFDGCLQADIVTDLLDPGVRFGVRDPVALSSTRAHIAASVAPVRRAAPSTAGHLAVAAADGISFDRAAAETASSAMVLSGGGVADDEGAVPDVPDQRHG